MSIIPKIKSFLPASSRSLHGMYAEVMEMHGDLGETHYHLGQMWGEVGMTRTMLEGDITSRLDKLQASLNSSDDRIMMMLWELYRKQGESIDEAKRRMVTSIEPATGVLRLYQLASAQLLFEFDAFCKQHELPYWLASGTLLGAVRHKGFIPWDDDLDVGMCRDDIERAREAVKGDPRYEITVLYDWYVHCRQVRFRYADSSIPCFIDLFCFDPVTSLSSETFVARETQRARLEAALSNVEEVSDIWNKNSQFLDDSSEEATPVRDIVSSHVLELYDEGVLAASLDTAAGIIWSIDNVNSGPGNHNWYLIAKETMLPLSTLPFEGHDLSVPADSPRYLEAQFGNYYDLPRQMGSYYNHDVLAALDDIDTRKKLSTLASME